MTEYAELNRKLDRLETLIESIAVAPQPKVKMRNLKDFTEEYGVPRDTVIDWIDHERGFEGTVAFKTNSRWYILIPAFEKWLKRKHRESYKYAKE